MAADVAAGDYYAVIPEWVLYADISPQAVRLYAVLRRYADKSSGEAHPTRKMLAERLRVKDEKTVDAATAQLVAIGAVRVVPRYSEAGDRTANAYYLPSRPDKDLQPDGEGRGQDSPTVREPAPSPVGDETGEQEETQSLITTVTKTTVSRSDGFDDFWTLYPKKRGKDAAIKAWRSATKRASPDTIITGLRRQLGELTAREDQFRPYPQKWLNEGRWQDELTTVRQRPGFWASVEAGAP